MKFQGKLTHWNDDKGFGFVEPNGGGERAFVHIKSFTRCSRRPVDGDLIVYEKKQQKDGRYKAENIRLVADRKTSKKRNGNPRKLGAAITIGFCAFLVFVIGTGRLPLEVLYFYIAVSVVTFFAYALDKSAAQNNRWRTQESTLHLFGLMGGWPGAFYAQNKLRHKSKKSAFKHVFWFTVVINLAMFSWLLTQEGTTLLRSVLGTLG
ncbi:DUF1294 domain-containing protein [Corallincola holothuriorum]|uniref:DUF1294 domain-containing protein n=1 Tax=Corallincola holothuriorum TaxID=2282215 RepID=A0A368N8N9_9GAMM|nr:cold shock and DUF1294 domain-containing protein [Corallincola holothuriorum]RCU45629.1 DUF1294 domain-containing protein [Corallincola holothuriorum]